MVYLQHRISHMWDVSKKLFDKGYLTIGWQDYYHSELLNATLAEGVSGFDKAAKGLDFNARNRWCLQRFFSLQPGDTVVVPLYEKNFAIARVTGGARPISELPVPAPELEGMSGRKIVLDGYLKYADDLSKIDLGFFVPIDKNSIKLVPRTHASAKLQSRMKHQYINVWLDDLIKDVEEARFATGPINLRDKILDTACSQVLDALDKLNDRQLEHLVKWYMEQCGASYANIPAKNEAGKEDGADADVVAEFAHLGVVFFIQVKKHEGYTSGWAVEQIIRYKEQKEKAADEFTYIPWVVTTALFQDEVVEKAHAAGVRLIDGPTLAKMILDTGIKSINDIIVS